MSKGLTISQKEIENRIFVFRDSQVMLDRDLAEMYQVETKVLNKAVKRNIDRFPKQFRFQFTDNEKMELVTNCDQFRFLNSLYVNSSSKMSCKGMLDN
ncbi:MAG: ORF6N domain-containing protein [Bacteroidetes bacterium]|nr:ORF6N domain-containing protein [Bacteroidota bacterium]NCQ12099.1 ORF6N domain-containing protein [Bacteroidota bacterium]